MENNYRGIQQNQACREYKEFELRNHQIETDRALELQVTDLLKDSDEERIAISKADIILIFSIYEGGIIEFFNLYKKYIMECKQKRWKACDKPHWFLKRSID